MPIFHADFLPLIHLDSPGDWDLLLGACRGYLTTRDHGRLRDYLSTSAKAVLVEVDYIDKDYRDTFANFYAKKFANYPSRAVRLHFFRQTIPPDAIWDLRPFQAEYIGYVIVRPTRINSIGRTILDPRRIDGRIGTMCLP